MSKPGDSQKRTPEQIERHRQRSKEWYAKNREAAIAKVADYQRRNKEKVLAARRARYRAAHDHYIGKGREYAQKRTVTGKAAAYREAIREQQRGWSRARASDVTDGYARELLAKNTPLSAADIPQELVEVKKLEIKLKRTLKNEQRSAIAQ